MQVEIKIDSSYIDPKVIILTASMTEDVSNMVLCQDFGLHKYEKFN